MPLVARAASANRRGIGIRTRSIEIYAIWIGAPDRDGPINRTDITADVWRRWIDLEGRRIPARQSRNMGVIVLNLAAGRQRHFGHLAEFVISEAQRPRVG